MNPWQEELQALCEAVVEDRLTEEQRRQLEALVLEQPEARRYYVEYLHQHGCLHWSGAESVGSAQRTSPAPDRVPRVHTADPTKPRSRFRRLLAPAALAASVLIAFGVWFSQRGSAEPAAVATLVSVRACKWDGGTLPTEEGARLAAGRLRLAEGVASLVFANGAEVTLEAPADLELVSAQRCILHSGRLVAKVPPPAIGFTVDTPTAVLHDLGTEFGVNVRDNRTADVQVFNGKVDVQHRSSGQTESLETGRNRRFGADKIGDFDPQAESPVGPEAKPPVAGARVVSVTTAMGRGKDAYVQPLYPSPHSSDILLLVKNTKPAGSDYNRKAYLALDLKALPEKSKLVDAHLSFTYTPTGMGYASQVPDATFAVYGLKEESLDDWNEKTLRWSNAPANRDGGANLDLDKVVLLGKFEIAQGAPQGTYSIAGPALVDFVNADTNGLATFILVRETVGSGRTDLVHGFANKNHPTLPPPTLKATVVPRGE